MLGTALAIGLCACYPRPLEPSIRTVSGAVAAEALPENALPYFEKHPRGDE